MRFRSLSFVIGLVLAVGAFVALLVMGQVVNPSPYPVVVVVAEVAPGSTLSLDMVGVDAQSVDPRVANEYILEDELDQYLGAAVVEPLHPGQPLMHAHLVRADNPAAARRLALALEDESLAAMVVPVSEENAPQNILAGDRVDVIYGVGDVSTQMTSFLPEMASFGMETPVPLPGEQGEEGSEGPAPSGTPAPGRRAPGAKETPQPTPTPLLSFPLAKVCVRDLRVLDVIHEEQPNPAYGGPESGEPPTIPGRVLAILVAVPREQEEMLHYVVTTGQYQVALLSPNAPVDDDSATLGMTWDDMEAFFWGERDRALAIITDTAQLRGPGASAVLPEEDAATEDVATPDLATKDVVTGDVATETVEAGESTAEAEAAKIAVAETAATEDVLAETAVVETAAQATATPAPASTTTPAAVGEASNPAPAEGGGGQMLGGGLQSTLTGAACSAVGLLLLAVVVFAAFRVFRKRQAEA